MISGQLNGDTSEVLDLYKEIMNCIDDYEIVEFQIYNTLVEGESTIKFTYSKKEGSA